MNSLAIKKLLLKKKAEVKKKEVVKKKAIKKPTIKKPTIKKPTIKKIEGFDNRVNQRVVINNVEPKRRTYTRRTTAPPQRNPTSTVIYSQQPQQPTINQFDFNKLSEEMKEHNKKIEKEIRQLEKKRQ